METVRVNEPQKENKYELVKAFDKLRLEIIFLKNQLNSVNREKEALFAKKYTASKEIKERIQAFRENRLKRDDLTKQVREFKQKRDISRKEISEKILSFKKLLEAKNKIFSKADIKNPFRIKKIIENIETKMETEVMPFQKEKELFKKVRDLQRSLEDAAEAEKLISDIRKVSSEITLGKKFVRSAHLDIQKIAAESQKIHEEMIKNSKEIDALKAKEKEYTKTFFQSRKIFNEANRALKEKLNLINAAREKIDKIASEEEETRKSRQNINIQRKENEIEQKFKTGKKLTTDDFLAFQDLIKNKNK